MQSIIITGYLSRDAEKTGTRDGTEVTRWNIPVKQGFGENERTNWYRVSIWGKRADYASKARKGEFVTVAGDLTIGEYEGKLQLEIRANDFQAVRTAPKEAGGNVGSHREPDGSQGHASGFGGGFGDDDLGGDSIPFATNRGIW